MSSQPKTSTILVLRGNHHATHDRCGGTFCFGPDVLFNISIEGAGSIDWSFDTETSSLAISSTRDTDDTTALRIDSLAGKTVNVGRIAIVDPVGAVFVDASLDSIVMRRGGAPSVEVHGSLGVMEVSGDWAGALEVTGDLGSLEVEGSLRGAEPIKVHGRLDSVDCSGSIAQSLQVGGSLGAVAARSVDGNVEIEVGGSLGGFTTPGDVGREGSEVAVRVAGDVTGWTAGSTVFVDLEVTGKIVSFTTMGRAPVAGSITARSIVFLTIGGDLLADVLVTESIEVVAIAGAIGPGVFCVGGDVGLLALEGIVSREIEVAGSVERSEIRADAERVAEDRGDEEETKFLGASTTDRGASGPDDLEEETRHLDEETRDVEEETRAIEPSSVALSEATPIDDPTTTPAISVDEMLPSDSARPEGDRDDVAAILEAFVADSDAARVAETLASDDDAMSDPASWPDGVLDGGDRSPGNSPPCETELGAPASPGMSDESTRDVAPTESSSTDWRELVRDAHARGKSFTEVFREAAVHIHGVDEDALREIVGVDPASKVQLDPTDPQVASLWEMLRDIARVDADPDPIR